jgi:hypothetical protein
VVFVAPHGGRRTRVVRRDDGINDLHTAELARELAERTDGFAVINRELDRNDVDLNRISQLSDAGRPFLAALEEAVASASASGSVPLVLWIHGWNVALEWCDIGIGASDLSGTLAGRFPTVGRECFDGFLEPLRKALETRDIGATFGHRYPALGKDNATQLFSSRHVDHDDASVRGLAGCAAAGGVDGVQLELGISLRWPGPRRDEFVGALTACVDRYLQRSAAGDPRASRDAQWSLPPRKKDPPAARPERGYSVQAALEDGGGLFLGVEAAGAGSMASRVCMALPDGKLLLFVGEGAWAGTVGRYELGGLDWQVVEAAANRRRDWPLVSRLRFRGPVVAYPRHDAFVDLEQGLSGAELVDCSFDLTFEYVGDSFGEISGSARIGDAVREIRTLGVCERGSRGEPGAFPRARVALTGGLDTPLHADIDLSRHGPTSPEDKDDWLDRFDVETDSGSSFSAAATLRVPVYRSLPDGTAVKVTFGVVEAGAAETAVPDARGVFETIEHVKGRDFGSGEV